MRRSKSHLATEARARPPAVWLLITLHFLLALGALAGGATFMLAPDGHLIQMPLSNLKDSPFHDFLVPGMLLFTFVGIFPMAVAYGLWRLPPWRWPEALNPFKDEHWSWAGSMAAGAIIIVWITVQVLLIRGIAFLHYLYWAWGVALVTLTLRPSVRGYCHRTPQ